MVLEDRFWDKVETIPFHTCWEWAACRTKKGYGQFGANGKVVLAHRFSYELKNGPIPDGMCVCHRCDNPGCVRVEHLFLGTRAENNADKETKGRGNPARGDRNGRYTKPERTARGERNGRAKLTEAQVAEIRALYAAGGVTHRELGRRFGVSGAMVGDIVRGKKWK